MRLNSLRIALDGQVLLILHAGPENTSKTGFVYSDLFFGGLPGVKGTIMRDTNNSIYNPVSTNVILTLYYPGGNDLLHS